MSKISLSGNASGTGTLTIAAPNTNSNISFNLPSTLGSAGASDFVTADASGNVGIGTTSPAQRLEVASATGGAVGLRYVGNSGYATLGTDGNNNILFSIGNPPAEVGRFNSGGTLILKGGSTSATGTGITFPATQSASSDANTLDDYEEGTWTPSLDLDSGSGITYSGRSGVYVKIGQLVWLRGSIALSSKGTAGGNVRIIGFPFTTSSGNGQVTVDYWDALASGLTFMSGYNTGTTAYITGTNSAQTGITNAIQWSTFGNTTSFQFNVLYITST